MCRNIKKLSNSQPSASDQEIHDSALQFIRKVSGLKTPSQGNQDAFEVAVNEIEASTKKLIQALLFQPSPQLPNN